MTDKTIEYYYSAHSAYAYLGAPTLMRIAAAAGWRIRHRPFDFHPVIRAAGGQALAERTQAHIDYFFGRELIRWGAWRDLPILAHRPTHHDNTLAPASGMIMASDDPDALSFAILQAHWRDDADIADRDTLVRIARQVGQDGEALHAAAQTDAARAAFDASTRAAMAQNVFGSPTYVVAGDMFYGQDRLDLVARALEKPFAR